MKVYFTYAIRAKPAKLCRDANLGNFMYANGIISM